MKINECFKTFVNFIEIHENSKETLKKTLASLIKYINLFIQEQRRYKRKFKFVSGLCSLSLNLASYFHNTIKVVIHPSHQILHSFPISDDKLTNFLKLLKKDRNKLQKWSASKLIERMWAGGGHTSGCEAGHCRAPGRRTS